MTQLDSWFSEHKQSTAHGWHSGQTGMPGTAGCFGGVSFGVSLGLVVAATKMAEVRRISVLISMVALVALR